MVTGKKVSLFSHHNLHLFIPLLYSNVTPKVTDNYFVKINIKMQINFSLQIVKLKDEEIPAAKKAMFTKHPVMAKWPPSHGKL